MAAADRTGWLGGLKSVLRQVEATHAPRPDTDENIVQIPHGLEKLRKAIVSIQNEIVEAQTERSTFEEAWRTCQMEAEAAFAKNLGRQKDANHRLQRLQQEWINITQDLGIKAELVAPQIDGTEPERGET